MKFLNKVLWNLSCCANLVQQFQLTADVDWRYSDPLAYDRLIRQHQTAAERESEGRRRGWAGTLETSLLRSEAKLAKADPNNPKYFNTAKRSNATMQAQRKGPGIDWAIEGFDSEPDMRPSINGGQEGSIQSDNKPRTDLKGRQLGQHQWHDLLAQRFIDGYDENFDYKAVDEDETLDEEWVGQRDQEAWFSEEEAAFESQEGETGIQDF